MKKIMISSLFNLFIFSALACDVSLFSRVYVINQDKITSNDLIKNSDCPNQIKAKLLDFLSSGRGVVTANMLVEIFPDTVINIQPSKVVIEDFAHFLERTLNFSSSKKIISLNLPSASPTLSLNEQEFLSSSCADCKSGGNTTVKLDITNAIENRNTTKWINILVGSKAMIYKAKTNISSFTKIEDESLFEKEEVFVSEPAKYVSNFEQLKYKQIVRPIKKGDLIEITSTMAYPVVRSGDTIKVISSSTNISIETSGISLEPGKVDQIIRIKNLNSNKIFSAKVVDKNTARIDL